MQLREQLAERPACVNAYQSLVAGRELAVHLRHGHSQAQLRKQHGALSDDDARGCYGNALRCAVELSILDAYGRLLGGPVSNVINHLPEAAAIRRPPERVRYSGAIATAKPA